MVLRVLFGVTCCLFVTSASGQTRGVATDIELNAAYCLGYRLSTRAIPLPDQGPFADEARSAATEREQTILRLQDYLISKGYLSSATDRDATPVLVARKHGVDDFNACMQSPE